MLKNWLCYLFLLLCTTAFFICFNGYYSIYVFTLSLALPFLSLVISLPGMLMLRVSVTVPDSAQPARAQKAAAVPLHVSVANRSFLPTGRARVQFVIENTFTGDIQWESLEFSSGRQPQVLEHKFSSNICGEIVCRLRKARSYDLLGLFWLPVKLRADSACRIIVQPTVYAPNLGLDYKRSPDGEGERYSLRKPGSDPTELFDLRDYRPGDRLNRVDWKLSQKTGDLLVKESSLPLANRVLLVADLDGDGMEADMLMDVLATLSACLGKIEAEHAIGFSRAGALAFLEVNESEEVYAAIETVLCSADRRPLPLRKPAEAPQDVSRVAYLCPEPEAGAVSMLEELYPAARLTVVHLRPLERGQSFPADTQLLRVRQGCVAVDLDGALL